jgi:hypothetical protein
MHWEVLIVPLIALGVWILGTLFKPEDNTKQQQQRRLGPRGPGGSRPPVTDLDRFLAEARQRRQEIDGGRLPTPPVRPAPPRPTPPPPRSDGQRTTMRSRPAVPQTRPPRKPMPLPGPVPVEVLPDPVPAQAVEVPVEVLTQVKMPAPPPPPSAKQPPSPIVAQVLALLRTPQSTGTAFVLREILGAPLSKRPGGPGHPGPPIWR